MACVCSEATARLLIHLLYLMLPNSAMAHADWRITLHVTIRGGGACSDATARLLMNLLSLMLSKGRYDYAYKRSTLRKP